MSTRPLPEASGRDVDGVFVDDVLDLPVCMGHGDSQEAAPKHVNQTTALWIVTARVRRSNTKTKGRTSDAGIAAYHVERETTEVRTERNSRGRVSGKTSTGQCIFTVRAGATHIDNVRTEQTPVIAFLLMAARSNGHRT